MTKAREQEQATEKGTGPGVKGTVRTVLFSLRLLLRAFQRKKRVEICGNFYIF